MALAVTLYADTRDVWGGRYDVGIFKFAPGAAGDYVTGGYALTAAMFGLGRILRGVKPIGGNPAAGKFLPHFDSTNSKFMVFYPTGGTGANPTTPAAPAILTGASSVTLGSAGLSPGFATELPNAADLNTTPVTWDCLVITLG